MATSGRIQNNESGGIAKKQRRQMERNHDQAFLWFIKAFMGFLVNHLKQPREELSLLRLCDWKLMKGFLEFKKQRSGKDHYTHSDEMLVRHYRSVLKAFMPFLWKDAD